MESKKTKEQVVGRDFHEEVGETLTDLIDEGIMEVSGIDCDGNFSYRLTTKGEEAITHTRAIQKAKRNKQS